MSGDERARHCSVCRLNVYDISALSRAEVGRLIEKREGRLCIRLHRRPDGTVLTRDCPIGLKAVQRRVVRRASAALTAVLGLFSVSFGQKDEPATIVKLNPVISRPASDGQPASLSGTLMDSHGAVIPGAVIGAVKGGLVYESRTDENGIFAFSNLPHGVYEIRVNVSNFKRRVFKNVLIRENMASSLDISLDASDVTEIVGIFLDDVWPGIDMTGSSNTKRITRRMIDRFPY